MTKIIGLPTNIASWEWIQQVWKDVATGVPRLPCPALVKFQEPSSREAPNIQFQISSTPEPPFWSLVSLWSLDFGSWSFDQGRQEAPLLQKKTVDLIARSCYFP